MAKKVTVSKVLETQSITAKQEQAIGLMLAGTSLPDTAAQLGVGRGTLYRWLREDPDFIAAWNGWRRDLARAARSRLLTIGDTAVTTVQEAIEKGNAKLAFDLIKQLGLFVPEPPGSDDAEVVRRETEIAKKKQEQQLAEQDLRLLLGE